MSQTFDIRFARYAGLAGLFEAPSNDFGWKGSGKLRIDPDGIDIAAPRGFRSLFASRSRRVPAEHLAEVYREGNALRLVFGTRDAQQTLPVWARDGEAAAAIVKLLPTRHTVELDEPVDRRPAYRFDRPLALKLLAAIALVGGIGAVVLLGRSGSPDPTAQARSSGPVSSTPAAVEPEVQARSRESGAQSSLAAELSAVGDAASRSRRDASNVSTEATDAATTQLGADATPEPEREPYTPPRYFASYNSELALLRADYADWRGRATTGAMLGLEQRWWQLTVHIYNRSRDGVEYGPSPEVKVLAISRAWRNHLSLYAEYLRTGDPSLLPAIQAELAFAERLTAEFLE